ncbi:MAG: hypothetical protein KDD50_05930 [Bdellovibrionales bacterium]|nr:hypothetical protein [Bdellovibrionales bacterium]
MTTELVLLLGIYAFILLGIFSNDNGPLATFKKSGPRLSARIERDITIGDQWKDGRDGTALQWEK